MHVFAIMARFFVNLIRCCIALARIVDVALGMNLRLKSGLGHGIVRPAVGSWSVGVASGIIPNACIFKYVNELTKAKCKLYQQMRRRHF